jgi:hypothetical protein
MIVPWQPTHGGGKTAGKTEVQAANRQEWMKPKPARQIGVLIWDTRRDGRQEPVWKAGREGRSGASRQRAVYR